jgi:hypothetical protein
MTTPEVIATVGGRRRRLFRRLAMLKAQVPELAPALVLKAVLDLAGPLMMVGLSKLSRSLGLSL